MNRKLPPPLFRPLPLGIAVLLLGCGIGVKADAGLGRSPATAPAASLIVEAAEETAGKRPVRHVRASLSMPYFSFAQSLRPRG